MKLELVFFSWQSFSLGSSHLAARSPGSQRQSPHLHPGSWLPAIGSLLGRYLTDRITEDGRGVASSS